MAFTGTPVVKLVSENLCRITGVSLLATAAGTISLSGGTGEILLPAHFQPKPYATVSLQDSIAVSYEPDDLSQAKAIPVECVKTGDEPVDFLITLTNNAIVPETGSNDSPELEIYVRFH